MTNIERVYRKASVQAVYLLVSATVCSLVLRDTINGVVVATELPNYAALFDYSSRSLLQRMPILPVAIIGALVGLPVTSTFVLYYVAYLVLAGYLFANFVRDYAQTILGDGDEAILSAYLFPAAGAVIFTTFPYMLAGDNFPQAFALRVWLPAYLWTASVFLRKKSRLAFLLWTAVLSVGTIIEIRFLLSGGLIGLGLLVIPRFLADRERAVFLAFALHGVGAIAVATPVLLHDAGVFLGVGVQSATNIGVPFTRQAFESTYAHSTWINALRGLSFFATFDTWSAVYGQFYLGSLFASLSFLLPILAIGLPSLWALFSERRTKAFVYSIIGFWAVILVLFTRGPSGVVPVVTLAFAVHGWSQSPVLERFLLLFRTPRFLSLLTETVYSLMLPIGLSMTVSRLAEMNLWNRRVFRVRLSRAHLAFALTAVTVLGMLSFSAPAFVEGGWFRPSPELHRHELLASTLGDKATSALRITSFDLNGMNWVFPDHQASEAHSIFHFYLDYLFGPAGLVHRAPTEMPEMLEPWGYRYVVVDRTHGGTDSFESHVQEAFGDPEVEISGFAVYPTGQGIPHGRDDGPVLVFGGLEAYRHYLGLSKRLGWSRPPVPLFADGPPPPASLQPSHILIPGYMSSVNVFAWSVMNEQGSRQIELASHARFSNPEEAWSPGYVTDTHQGLWNPFAGSQPGYAWQYSHLPQDGFIRTSAVGASLDVPLGLKNGEQVRLFARVLTGPNQGIVELLVADDVISIDAHTQANRTAFQWFDLGKIQGDGGGTVATLVNRDGMNALNLFLLIPENVYQSAVATTVRDDARYAYLVTSSGLQREEGHIEFEFDLVREQPLHLTIPRFPEGTEGPRLWVDGTQVEADWAYIGNSSRTNLGSLSAGLHRIRMNRVSENYSSPSVVGLLHDPGVCCEFGSGASLSTPSQPLHLQASTEFTMEFTSNGAFSVVIPRPYTNAWAATIDGCEVTTYVFPAYYVFVGVAVIPESPEECTGYLRIMDLQEPFLFLLSSIALVVALGMLALAGVIVSWHRVSRFIERHR